MKQEDGQTLVRYAKEIIKAHFSHKDPDLSVVKSVFSKNQGVFVTLKHNGNLRGCIGYPLPIYPLWQAINKAASAAAFSDPRFPSIGEGEEFDVEVSVMTTPEQIRGLHEKFPEAIEIGKHGLVVESGWASGLLLPQVATEQDWDATVFLEQTCVKAGVPPGEWKQPKTKVYTFEAEVFKEKK